MLIEKAYAKYFKSYENIQNGLMGHFLTALTGAPSKYLCRNSYKLVDSDKAWAFIRDSMDKHYVVAVSNECNDPNSYMGRQSVFSYSVLDSQEVFILTTTKKKRERILKLNNCWGRYEWKGRWSEYSDVWSEELRHQLGYEKADDSIMWINIEDMLTNFGQVCVCMVDYQKRNTCMEISFAQAEK